MLFYTGLVTKIFPEDPTFNGPSKTRQRVSTLASRFELESFKRETSVIIYGVVRTYELEYTEMLFIRASCSKTPHLSHLQRRR